MNVELAWEQNIIGRGSVVSILDDGLEHTHPDLHANYVCHLKYSHTLSHIYPSPLTSSPIHHHTGPGGQLRFQQS